MLYYKHIIIIIIMMVWSKAENNYHKNKYISTLYNSKYKKVGLLPLRIV